jgi:hypothetical protein
LSFCAHVAAGRCSNRVSLMWAVDKFVSYKPKIPYSLGVAVSST